MDYARIERVLGTNTVRNISEHVLLAATQGVHAEDPDAHFEALQELVTALLAVLVTREHNPGDRVSALDKQAARLCDLVALMQQVCDGEEAGHGGDTAIRH